MMANEHVVINLGEMLWASVCRFVIVCQRVMVDSSVSVGGRSQSSSLILFQGPEQSSLHTVICLRHIASLAFTEWGGTLIGEVYKWEGTYVNVWCINGEVHT